MTRSEETFAFFRVADFGDDLDAVTAKIGVSPTEAWRRGDPMPQHPKARRTYSNWQLDSGLPRSASFDDHVAALLQRLEPLADGVQRLTADYSACLHVAVYTEYPNPGFHLPTTVVKRLALLGVDVDFDIYLLPHGPEPE